MAQVDSPAARHRTFAGTFSAVVAGTGDWDTPTPVPEWTARDVVDHLVSWLPGFLAAGGITLSTGPAVTGDPASAWRHHADAVQHLIETRGSESFAHPMAGTHPLAEAIDRFYSADVYMHTWDLATATGQSVDLDPDFAATLLEGMAAMEDVLRGSGQYGAAIPVPKDAPVVDRLMGFVGRDPGWRRP